MTDSRGTCPVCGRRVALRRGGQVRTHRQQVAGTVSGHTLTSTTPCHGTGLPAAEHGGFVHPLETLALRRTP